MKPLNFLEELEWRGMRDQISPGIEEELKKGKVIGYIGFDPTAPSMTIGNFVQIMLLKLFQLSGHQPIVLMGGATGRIGDPSGKDKERQLKDLHTLDENLDCQIKQIKKFLEFDKGDNKAILVNNLDFYKDMNALEFLREVGKTLTINYMMSKESVKSRIKTGISFTEFSYQLLQGYDYLKLYKEYDCILQMGGSDQWGNITTGMEFVRKQADGKAYAITTHLLTKADGSKFGKSEEGNIWLSPEHTSAYKFYQFWINCDDRDLPKFMRYFTLKSKQEVLELEKEFLEDKPNKLKEILAKELTIRVHSEEVYESVKKVSQLLFNHKAKLDVYNNLTFNELGTIAEEIPNFYFNFLKLEKGINIIDLLSEETNLFDSKSKVRRAIQENSIFINKVKVQDFDLIVNNDFLLHEFFILIDYGKKNKFILRKANV